VFSYLTRNHTFLKFNYNVYFFENWLCCHHSVVSLLRLHLILHKRFIIGRRLNDQCVMFSVSYNLQLNQLERIPVSSTCGLITVVIRSRSLSGRDLMIEWSTFMFSCLLWDYWWRGDFDDDLVNGKGGLLVARLPGGEVTGNVFPGIASSSCSVS